MKTITVYGTMSCAPCKTLKKALTDKQIPFRYWELDENYSGDVTSVPTTIIHDDGNEIERIVGFNPSKIIEAYHD